MSNPEQQDATSVIAFEADDTLKKLVGGEAGLNALFSKENIEKCQQIIDEARSSFYAASLVIIEGIFKAIENCTLHNYKETKTQIALQTQAIKEQAELFKFPFILEICTDIIDSCEQDKSGNIDHMMFIYNLVSSLNIALLNKIEDGGGKIGEELLASVKEAMKKINSMK